jgi:hypothetical protein
MLIIAEGRKIPSNLLTMAARAWVDGLPDEENRQKAKKIMDPHIKMLNEGDTSHVSNSPLDPGFK